MRLALLLLAACTPAFPVEESPVVAVSTLPSYDGVVAGIEAQRLAYAARYDASPEQRGAILAEARAYVEKAVLDDLFPQWAGTDWDFYGTTTTPREGQIACGYYVSTILQDAGFRVERVPLAQQAAEHIIESFVAKGDIHRYSWASGEEIVDAVRAEGDGLYLLGLDYHVAFLAVRGGNVRMCHSSAWAPGSVTCEDALSSPAMASDYRVTGKLFSDAMIDSWLRTTPFATVTH